MFSNNEIQSIEKVNDFIKDELLVSKKIAGSWNEEKYKPTKKNKRIAFIGNFVYNPIEKKWEPDPILIIEAVRRTHKEFLESNLITLNNPIFLHEEK